MLARDWKWGRRMSRSARERAKSQSEIGCWGPTRSGSRREKLVGGNGGLTRIIYGIDEKRKAGRVHVMRVYVRTCALERRRIGNIWNGREMRKRDSGNTWSDSSILGPSSLNEFGAPCTWRLYNPLIEGKQLKMFNRTFVWRTLWKGWRYPIALPSISISAACCQTYGL